MMPLVGVTILGNEPHDPTGALGEQNIRQACKAARALGCDFIRARVFWRVSPLGGFEIDGAEWAESVCDIAEEYGLLVMVVSWHEGLDGARGNVSTGLTLDEYETLYTLAMTRLNGRVWAWCCENEPDDPAAGLAPAEYARRVDAMIRASIAADPAAIVVAGELKADSDALRGWPEEWLAAQARAEWLPDIISLHYYDAFRAEWGIGESAGMVGKVAWLEDLLLENGLGDSLSVWVTECGGASAPTDIWTMRTEEHLAQIVTRTLCEAQSSSVGAVCWYRLADQTDDGEVFKNGLIGSDGWPKRPAWRAWNLALPDLRLGWTVAYVGGPDRIGRRLYD